MDFGPLNMNYGISGVSHVSGETQEMLPAGIIRPSDDKVEEALDYVLPKRTVDTQILQVLTPAVDGKRTLPTEYDAAFPSYLSTHPGVPTRISYLETLMGGRPPSAPVGECPGRLKRAQMQLLILDKGPLAALEHFSRDLEATPDNGDALFGRALAEKEMGRVKESIEDLKKAHALRPQDPQILKELGIGFVRVGRINERIRALERSLVLSGEDAETAYYLGQGYQIQKKTALAIESYLKAVALYPDLPDLNLKLGSAYQEKGEMDQSHFYYGLHFKNEGKPKYARYHFEKALELSGPDLERRERIAKELAGLDR